MDQQPKAHATLAEAVDAFLSIHMVIYKICSQKERYFIISFTCIHFSNLYLFLFVYVCVYIDTYTICSAHRGQKRVLQFLKLELQVVMSQLTWMLGTKLSSSGRAPTTHSFNSEPRLQSPDLKCFITFSNYL